MSHQGQNGSVTVFEQLATMIMRRLCVWFLIKTGFLQKVILGLENVGDPFFPITPCCCRINFLEDTRSTTSTVPIPSYRRSYPLVNDAVGTGDGDNDRNALAGSQKESSACFARKK